ncbi:hypothetical protein KCU59_g157, partial [Aureobasidium melanogenum]
MNMNQWKQLSLSSEILQEEEEEEEEEEERKTGEENADKAMLQKEDRAEQYCSKSVESTKRSTSRTKAFLVASVLASLTEPVHDSSSTTTAATVSVTFVSIAKFTILLQHCLLAMLGFSHHGLRLIETGGVFLSRPLL